MKSKKNNINFFNRFFFRVCNVILLLNVFFLYAANSNIDNDEEILLKHSFITLPLSIVDDNEKYFENVNLSNYSGLANSSEWFSIYNKDYSDSYYSYLSIRHRSSTNKNKKKHISSSESFSKVFIRSNINQEEEPFDIENKYFIYEPIHDYNIVMSLWMYAFFFDFYSKSLFVRPPPSVLVYC